MTLPVFRSLSSVTYASRASPITVAKPTGTVADDIMVAAGAIGHAKTDTGLIMSPPDGTWTAITTATAKDDGTFEVILNGWWKRAGSSEPASYDFTENSGGTRSDQITIASYSGCIATGNPIDALSTNSGTGTTATALGITTTVADTLLVVNGQNWEAAGTAGAISGGTERFDSLITVCDAPQVTAGATGNKTYTSGSLASEPWQSWMFALKPVATGAISVNVTGQQLTASVGQVAVSVPLVVYSSRDYAFGNVLGGGYVVHRAGRDYALTGSYVAEPKVSGGVSVSVTGQALAAAVGSVSVSAKQTVSATVTGQQLTASVGSVSVSGKASVSVTGQQLTATVGGVTVTTGAAITGRANVWSGSAWSLKPAKVWTGSAWLVKPIKVWTGSAWKVVGGSSGFVWPSAANTGAILGGLTAYSGSMTISSNTAISNKTVTGQLNVNAGVTLTCNNCSFISDDYYCINGDGAGLITLNDCTLTSSIAGVKGTVIGAVEMHRCNVSGTENGIVTQGGSTIIDFCYIHDLLGSGADPHIDGIEVTGGQSNFTISNCRIASADTSCIFLSNQLGNLLNITLNHNYCTGADFLIRCEGDKHPSFTINGVTISNNVLSDPPNTAFAIDPGPSGSTAPTLTGNVNEIGTPKP